MLKYNIILQVIAFHNIALSGYFQQNSLMCPPLGMLYKMIVNKYSLKSSSILEKHVTSIFRVEE
jgi:hypothetical protein